jgi:hypothetical protein
MKYLMLSAVISAVLTTSVARAEQAPPDLLNDKFQFSIGTFGLSSDPSVELNGSSGTGNTIDFDKELGGGDANRLRIDGQWRFNDRHKLRFSAFDLEKSNKKTLTDEIEWGDTVFPVAVEVGYDHQFGVVEMAYDYSFLRRENYELGASIGLHYTHFEAGLNAKASTSGGVLAADIKEEASVDAPLPVIGLRGLWALPHNLWLDASAQYFALSIDDIDGNLQDYRVFLTWQPKTWLGIGAGYNRFAVNVDVEKDNFDGSLDWVYSGPMIFYSVAF